MSLQNDGVRYNLISAAAKVVAQASRQWFAAAFGQQVAIVPVQFSFPHVMCVRRRPGAARQPQAQRSEVRWQIKWLLSPPVMFKRDGVSA